MNYIALALIALPITFIIDIVWIGLVANRFYKQEMGDMFADPINWVPAVLFYIIYMAGLAFFVIEPALVKHSLMYAVLAGAFFGLVAYATYDLTGLAVIRNWSVLLTVVDMAWGMFLTASVSGLTYLVATSFLGR